MCIPIGVTIYCGQSCCAVGMLTKHVGCQTTQYNKRIKIFHGKPSFYG